MTVDDPGGFELPSTSGRHRLQFRLAELPDGLRLLAVYETCVYGQDSLEPTVFTYHLPPIKVVHEEIAELMTLCLSYGRLMVSREAQGEGAVFQVSHEHQLSLKFEPGGPERGVAGWQALFSFQVIAGPSLTLSGSYIVDVTCLDVFTDGLGGVLGYSDGMGDSRLKGPPGA